MQEINQIKPIRADLDSSTSIVLLVDSQGNGDYSTIVEAVTQAPDHSTIFLVAGTYRESFTIDRSLTMIGDESAPAEIVGRIACGGDRVILQHLFIHSTGVTTAEGDCITQFAGDLQIRNCTVQSGRCNAIALANPQTRLTVCHCTIKNSAVGIHSQAHSEINLDHCEIKHNQSALRGILGGQITLNHCEIHSNTNNAIELGSCDRVTLSHCQVFNNQGVGIVIRNVLEFCFSHTEFSRHTQNGAWIDQHSRGIIDHCKFHSNGWPSLALENHADVDLKNSHLYEGFTEAIKVDKSSHLKATKTKIEGHNGNAICVLPSCSLNLKNCSVLNNTAAGLFISDGGYAVVEHSKFIGNGKSRKRAAIETHGKVIIRYCSINRNYLGLQVYDFASVILRVSNLAFNRSGGISVQGLASISKLVSYEGLRLPSFHFKPLNWLPSWDQKVSIGIASFALIAVHQSISTVKKLQPTLSAANAKIESLQSDLDHEKSMRSLESAQTQAGRLLDQETLKATYDREKKQSVEQQQAAEKEKSALTNDYKTLQTEKANLQEQCRAEKVELSQEKIRLDGALVNEKREVERLKDQLALRGYPPAR